MRAGYQAAAPSWAAGPGRMYEALARELLARAGLPVAGRTVLDLGSGTGAACRAALAAGARAVVPADLAPAMLRGCPPRAHPVAADARALPFGGGCFDLVVAACCLGHLPDLGAGLREIRRVGGGLAASSFAPGWTHPAKTAVDAVLASFGYRPPGWYAEFKQHAEPRAGDPDALAALAAAAGFGRVSVTTVTVATGLSTPAELAGWRLGLAHVAPFVRGLDPAARAGLLGAAQAAVAGTGPLRVAMLVLAAR